MSCPPPTGPAFYWGLVSIHKRTIDLLNNLQRTVRFKYEDSKLKDMKKKGISTLKIIGIAVIAITVVSVVVVGVMISPVEERELTTVKLGLGPPMPFNIYHLVPMEKGFFEEEGLKVEIKHYPIAAAGLDGLLGGDVDFSRNANWAFLTRAHTGTLRMIATSELMTRGFASLVVTDEVERPEDIKIANTYRGTVWDWIMSKWEEREGLEIQLESYGSPVEVVAALGRKDIDAGWLWAAPRIKALEEFDHLRILENLPEYAPISINIATRESICRLNPEIVEAFTRATIRGLEYIDEHYEEALKITADYIDLSVEETRAELANIDFMFRFKDEDIAHVRELYQYGVEKEFWDEFDFDLDEIFYKSAL